MLPSQAAKTELGQVAVVFGGGFPKGSSYGALLLVVPDEAIQVEGNPGDGPETFYWVIESKANFTS